MKFAAAFLLAGLLYVSTFGQVDTSKSHFWMMTYFINGTTTDYAGVRLAFSSDSTGIMWQKYNSENAILVPSGNVTGANDDRMRDPFMSYDSTNRRFNMVWTVSWTGNTIGWDTSSLLKLNTWGPQEGLAVGKSSNAYFSWAPEILWDDLQSKWMVYWSCSISGTNTRVMYSMITGTDFKTFSTPQILLNTSYDIIDADIIKVGPANYQMFFKDERSGYKYVRRASGATTPQGDFSKKISNAISGNTMEGPSAVKQGGEYHVFIDRYGNQGIHCYSAKDIETTTLPWNDALTKYGSGAGSTLIASHCNVIEVPKMLVKWMLYNDNAWSNFVKTKTDVKNSKMVPQTLLKTNPFDISNTKLFDLSGRTVGIVIGNTALSKSSAKALPAGLYFQRSINGLSPKVVLQK